MQAYDFQETIRRQRMVRPPYADKQIPRETLDRILANAQKSPSAGFSQGFAMILLEGDETKKFWELTQHPEHERDAPATPVIVLPVEHKQAYLDRYSQPDKAAFGMQDEHNWPAPFWTIDTAFASMIVMLSATAHGVGAWFFGIAHGEADLMAHLGVPDGWKPIGAIALGYPSAGEKRSPSLKRGRTPFEEFVHRGRW